MKVIVNKAHISEGKFPVFKSGTSLEIVDKCTGFYAWYSCIINNYKTYIHEDYFENGKLTGEYNPTELDAAEGEKLQVLELKNNWLYCKTETGAYGWIPGDNVKNI